MYLKYIIDCMISRRGYSLKENKLQILNLLGISGSIILQFIWLIFKDKL
jgi:hypothetical protein